MKVIRTEKKLCICCMEEHEVKTVYVDERTIFKNVPVNYSAEYFYCNKTEELYMDESMIRENDIRMKDAYRTETGLLTSEEIIAIRSKYDISQKDLCTLLGWGAKTITRYEGHQVQDKAHDYILKKLNHDPEWFLQLLTESRKILSQEVLKRYYEKALILYEDNQDQYLRKSIVAKYARYREQQMYNGNAQLSLDKVVDVIRFFSNSNRVTSLYKVKLMKLLWYADFLSYKLRGHAITGLVYQALPMGAVPIGHASIIALRGIVCEEIDMGDGTAYRFGKSESQEYRTLGEEDRKVLENVIDKMGKMGKEEIVGFMHKERAYIETVQRDIISFQYAEFLQI